jgi:3-hydroxyacyl-[acyl-carrier-protein] dehydratase
LDALSYGDGGELHGRVRVPPAHPILRGHFPGAPVVPGVLLLEAVRRACERVLGRGLYLTEVVDVRFTRPVAADETVALVAQLTVSGPQIDVVGEWQVAAGRCASFSLRLR